MGNVTKTLYVFIALGLNNLIIAQGSVEDVVDYFAANPRWVERYDSDGDGGMDPINVQFYLEGDSTLDGKSYHKLMANSPTLPALDERSGKRLQGLIRQEGRKVFYRGFILERVPYNASLPITATSLLPKEEVLLYDFGLELGDTLYVKDNPLFYSYIQRFPNDTAFVQDWSNNNIYRIYPSKFVNNIAFSGINTGHYNVIEGIGDFLFFLGQYNSQNPSFVCYSNDSSDFAGVVHPWQGNTDCDFATSIENREPTAKPKLYPQPSQGVVYVQNATLSRYQVYNSRGQQVLSNTQANGATQINLSHLANGLYFLHYSTSQGRQGVEKVIMDSY